MKSANWISATGRRPLTAAPIEAPTIIDSVSGVSMTRSSPNSAHRPSVARKTPPFLPTSSPRTMTDASRRISSASVSRIASMNVLRAISPGPLGGGRVALVALGAVPAAEAPGRRRLGRPVLGEDPAHRGRGIRVGLRLGVVGRVVDLGLDLGRDRGLGLVRRARPASRSWSRKRGSGSWLRELGELLLGPVLRLLVVRGVAGQADDLGLDERRALARAAPARRPPRAPGSRRARPTPSTTTPGIAVAGRAVGDVLGRPAACADGHADRVAVVLDDEDERQLVDRRRS